jgi:hypothetical protein
LPSQKIQLQKHQLPQQHHFQQLVEKVWLKRNKMMCHNVWKMVSQRIAQLMSCHFQKNLSGLCSQNNTKTITISSQPHALTKMENSWIDATHSLKKR